MTAIKWKIKIHDQSSSNISGTFCIQNVTGIRLRHWRSLTTCMAVMGNCWQQGCTFGTGNWAQISLNSPVHYFLNTQWEKVLEKKQTSSKNLLECIAQTQTNVETNAQIQAGYNLG